LQLLALRLGMLLRRRRTLVGLLLLRRRRLVGLLLLLRWRLLPLLLCLELPRLLPLNGQCGLQLRLQLLAQWLPCHF
jgi:hypothetical protein